MRPDPIKPADKRTLKRVAVAALLLGFLAFVVLGAGVALWIELLK